VAKRLFAGGLILALVITSVPGAGASAAAATAGSSIPPGPFQNWTQIRYTTSKLIIFTGSVLISRSATPDRLMVKTDSQARLFGASWLNGWSLSTLDRATGKPLEFVDVRTGKRAERWSFLRDTIECRTLKPHSKGQNDPIELWRVTKLQTFPITPPGAAPARISESASDGDPAATGSAASAAGASAEARAASGENRDAAADTRAAAPAAAGSNGSGEAPGHQSFVSPAVNDRSQGLFPGIGAAATVAPMSLAPSGSSASARTTPHPPGAGSGSAASLAPTPGWPSAASVMPDPSKWTYDYVSLVANLHAFPLHKVGDSAIVRVATKSGPVQVKVFVSEERFTHRTLTNLTTNRSEQVDLRELRLKPVPPPGSPAEEDGYLRDDTELWIEASSGMFTELSGHAPKVPGRVVLTIAGYK
jgi:hypothetical protein